MSSISSHNYCSLYFYLAVLNGVYRVVNGLAISIVRFLYVKKGGWVNGHPKMLISAGCLTVIISITMVYISKMENVSNRSLFNNCIGHNQVFQVYTTNMYYFFEPFSVYICNCKEYLKPFKIFTSMCNFYIFIFELNALQVNYPIAEAC